MIVVSAAAAISLLVVWLGYPLVVSAIAVWVPRRASRTLDISWPTVSVVLASADTAGAVQSRVQNLLAADYPFDQLEVVVGLDAINGMAAIDELEFADPRVHVVPGDSPGGKAATVNSAVRASRGQILVFTDTHQRFDRRSIPNLVAALESDPKLGAVSGALAISGGRLARTPAEWYWAMERWLRGNEARVHSVVGVTGSIYALRRELWSALPAGLLLDDLFVPMRLIMAGWRVGFEPEARAVDRRTFTAREEFRRKVRTLTGNLQICAWVPAVLLPWRNPVWAQFVLHKLMRLLTPYLILLAVVPVVWAAFGRLWRDANTATLAVAAGLFLVTVLVSKLRRSVVRRVEWLVLMPTAAFIATINGIRGRWSVWQR